MRRNRLLSLLSFFCLLFTPGSLLADEVFLKNAGTISGRIVEQTDEVVKVDIGDGNVGVPTSTVDRIVKGKTPLDDYEERASRLGPQDAKGWRSLGRWASQRTSRSPTGGSRRSSPPSSASPSACRSRMPRSTCVTASRRPGSPGTN